MSVEAAVVAKLQADATLAALLTGGIYADTALVGGVGLNGINVRDTPAAFDASGYLLPCARVRERAPQPYPASRPLRFAYPAVTARTVVEIHLYQNAGTGWATVTTAKARVFALLEGKSATGIFVMRWSGGLPPMPDPSMDGANHLSIEFAAIGYMAA